MHDLFRVIVSGRGYLADLKSRLGEIAHLSVLLAFADSDPTYEAGWLDRYERLFPRHRTVLIRGSHHFPHE